MYPNSNPTPTTPSAKLPNLDRYPSSVGSLLHLLLASHNAWGGLISVCMYVFIRAFSITGFQHLRNRKPREVSLATLVWNQQLWLFGKYRSHLPIRRYRYLSSYDTYWNFRRVVWKPGGICTRPGPNSWQASPISRLILMLLIGKVHFT